MALISIKWKSQLINIRDEIGRSRPNTNVNTKCVYASFWQFFKVKQYLPSSRLRPPLPKSTVSEKTSKLSLHYRKMQQTFLFQNIYNFLKKDQVLTDFWSQNWAYPPPIFSKKSDVFSYDSLLSKKFNLILLHWDLPFILDYLDYFLLLFVVLSQQSVISARSF